MGRRPPNSTVKRRNPSLRPVCWTGKLRGKRLWDIPRNVLNQRDIHTGYTVVHALASSKESQNVLKEAFNFLAKQNLMGKLLAKDRDGDVPLQSAIYSRAGSDIIMLILNFYPTARVKMLENRNKCHETAIEWALHQEDIDAFKLLLEQCIQYGALKDLTGINKGSRCSTFLHQCIVGRHTKILATYMRVCVKENVDIDICPVDPNGRTPWNYLVRYKDDEKQKFDEVLAILQDHNVNLCSLHANKKNQETMLHMAYRLNRPWVIDRLKATCGSATDRFKRKPQQRDRSFTTPCPQPRQQHPTLPPQVDVVHQRHAEVVREANPPQASAAEAGITHQQNLPETGGAHQARPARARKRRVGVVHHQEDLPKTVAPHQTRPAQGRTLTLQQNPHEAHQPPRPAQAHDTVHLHQACAVDQSNPPQGSTICQRNPPHVRQQLHLHQACVVDQPNPPQGSTICQRNPPHVRQQLHLHQACVVEQPNPPQGSTVCQRNPPHVRQQLHLHQACAVDQPNPPQGSTVCQRNPPHVRQQLHLHQACVVDQPNPPQGSTVCQRNPPRARQQLHLHQPTHPPGPQTPPNHELSRPREQPGTRPNHNQMPLHQPHHSSDDSSSDQEMATDMQEDPRPHNPPLHWACGMDPPPVTAVSPPPHTHVPEPATDPQESNLHHQPFPFFW